MFTDLFLRKLFLLLLGYVIFLFFLFLALGFLKDDYDFLRLMSYGVFIIWFVFYTKNIIFMSREKMDKLLKYGHTKSPKVLENQLDYKLSSSNYIVRLDGKGFSKFTKRHFEKPYDNILDQIMQNVTETLFKDFKVKFAYTQSDEITLVFDGTNDGFFDRRIQKIVSLISAKATGLFIKNLYDLKMFDAVNEVPTFDARVFQYNNIDELYESLTFRYFDCLRNSKLNLAMFLPKSERLNKSGKEIIELVKDKLDYFELPLSYRKGTFFVKSTVEKEHPYNVGEFVLRNVVKKMNIENFPEKEDFLKFFELNIKGIDN